MTSSGYPVFGANGHIGYYNSFTHEQETIAIGCRGTCGTIQRIPPKSYINGNAMCIDEIRRDLVQPEFLYHALSYRNVTDAVSGSAQPQITRASLRRVRFPLPPKPEQVAIAQILDAADTAIEKVRDTIQKEQAARLSLMQSAFGFEMTSEPRHDTDAGRIPKS